MRGEPGMLTVDVVSFVATVASLVLAIGAIWLSVVFFKMSADASKATTEAAKGIAASVERLEKLFDKLYSDTFSMMRDTVSDMRKHMWPTEDPEASRTIEEVENRADEKMNELRRNVEEQLSAVLQGQKIAGGQLDAVRQEMRQVLERAMVGSRQVETEAREETIREHLLRELRIMRRQRTSSTLSELIGRMGSLFPIRRIFMEIERMKRDGLIALAPDELAPDSEIRLITSRDLRKPEG